MRFAYRPYPVDPSPSDPSPLSCRPELIVRVRGAIGPIDGVSLWGILDDAGFGRDERPGHPLGAVETWAVDHSSCHPVVWTPASCRVIGEVL